VEQFITARDAQLWVSVEGFGVPVLLISGGPGCCDYLEPVAALLNGHAQTIRFDARGCGRSSPVSEFTFEASLADVERIREFIGAERWIVAGHSAGADLALAYAVEFPERLHGFVCLSGGRVIDDRSWHAAYSAARAAGLEPELDYAYPPNMDANRALSASWKAYCRRPDLWREIAQIQTQALFVYGAQDIRPSWPIEQVATLIPNADLMMLETAAHNLWQTHAEELGEALRGFVSKFR
jgi:proline iminopeptidase